SQRRAPRPTSPTMSIGWCWTLAGESFLGGSAKKGPPLGELPHSVNDAAQRTRAEGRSPVFNISAILPVKLCSLREVCHKIFAAMSPKMPGTLGNRNHGPNTQELVARWLPSPCRGRPLSAGPSGGNQRCGREPSLVSSDCFERGNCLESHRACRLSPDGSN